MILWGKFELEDLLKFYEKGQTLTRDYSEKYTKGTDSSKRDIFKEG